MLDKFYNRNLKKRSILVDKKELFNEIESILSFEKKNLSRDDRC